MGAAASFHRLPRYLNFSCAGVLSVATMSLLISASSCATLLYLSQISYAQEQAPVGNDTLTWGTSPLIFSKRTTCSGTCAECYGAGSVSCGPNDACFNPTIGDSCCADYNYSCSDGYYCAPGGLDMQCCANVSNSLPSPRGLVRPPWAEGRKGGCICVGCKTPNNRIERFHQRVH